MKKYSGYATAHLYIAKNSTILSEFLKFFLQFTLLTKQLYLP